MGKSTLLQLLAGLIEPDAGQIVRDPPTATVGYLAQEHDRVAAGVGAPVADPPDRAAGRPRSSWPRRRPPCRRVDAAAERGTRWPWSGSPAWAWPTSTPGSTDCSSSSGSDLEPGRPGGLDALGRPAGQGGPGRHRAVPLRPDPAGRADQRSRLRRPRPARDLGALPAGGHGHRLPRPGLPRADGGHRARARCPHRTGREYGGGWAATRPSGPTPGGTPTRPTSCYERRRHQLEGRAERQRQWATTGVRKEIRPAPGQRQGPAGLPDQPHREVGGQGPTDRSGP